MKKTAVAVAGLALLFLAGRAALAEKEKPKVDDRVFELRVDHAAEGKMKALHERFRSHTTKLFAKHGIAVVGFWSPTDEKEAEKKMYYVLAYPSKAAADKSWAAFRADPDWLTA
ncbi:MAG: NIPSNAP family protein, partial [Gemmataceae bacterium]